MQEGQRKDVERAFGVLQSRFAMISNPCRLWSRKKISTIMFACIVLHNMIIEDERDMEDGQRHYEYEGASQPPQVLRHNTPLTEADFNIHLSRQVRFRDAQLHIQLQKDLMDHLWNQYGDT